MSSVLSLPRRSVLRFIAMSSVTAVLPTKSELHDIREKDEWFWLCVYAAIKQHPVLEPDESKRTVMDYCRLEHLAQEEAVQVLGDAWDGRYEVEDIPSGAISIEDKVLMPEDKDRLQTDLL